MTRLPRCDEFQGERDDAGVEELDFVDADDVDLVDAADTNSSALRLSTLVYDGGVVGLGAVAGDGGAVVAEVDVGLEAGDALAGDAGALEAADELFGSCRRTWGR